MKSLNNFVLLIRYIEKDMHYRHKQTYKIRAGVLTSNDSIIVVEKVLNRNILKVLQLKNISRKINNNNSSSLFVLNTRFLLIFLSIT